MPRFKPGESGNPKGRPPGGCSVAEYIREKAGSDGRRYVDLLDGIAMDEKQPTRLRVEAAKILLARAFGSTPQQVDVAVQPILSADSIRAALDEAGLLDEPAEPAATELEVARSERVDDWLHGRWPPPSERG